MIIIITLSAFLRFIWSDKTPPSINWDEASLGYNAYSILKTGKDEWGRFLPISFEAFGDYKLPGYIYSDIPFIAALGLNEQSVRLPSRLAGVVSVLLLFLIVKSLTKREDLALVSALLLAVSPWSVFLSRVALEANLAFCFFLAGLFFFLKGLERKKLLILPSFFWGVTLFTYNSARVFVPFFLFGLIFIYKKELLAVKKKLILPVTTFIIFTVFAGYEALAKDSSSRYFWVAIVDQGAVNFLDQTRAGSNLPEIIGRLVYNRYNYFLFHSILNYLSHFSPNFLFLKGGSNYQFSIPGFGILYLIELPLILYGLIKIVKNNLHSKVVLTWVLFAAIPSAITREAPHALRAIFMLGALQIITAIGIVNFWNLFREKIFKWVITGAIGLVFVVEVYLYFFQYFNIYPVKYSKVWQYGMKQILQLLNSYQRNLLPHPNKKIYITKKYGEPHIFYLFFNQYDPRRYQNNPTLVRYSRTNWRWVDRLDNIYFVNDWEIKDKLKNERDALLITSPGNYPPQFKKLSSTYLLDGQPDLDLVETKK